MSDEETQPAATPKVSAVETAAEVVAQSPITQRLREAGATGADLENIRFFKVRPGDLFEGWVVSGSELVRTHHGLCKAYCAYRWLLLEDPPSSPNKTAAWRYISDVIAAPIFELGLKTRENQQNRAKKRRAAVGDEGETILQILAALIAKPEYRDLRAKELWPHLRAVLDGHGLDPREEAAAGDARNAYSYTFREGRRRLSYGSFANIVSKLRKKSP